MKAKYLRGGIKFELAAIKKLRNQPKRIEEFLDWELACLKKLFMKHIKAYLEKIK
jgi:hypothetical protein